MHEEVMAAFFRQAGKAAPGLLSILGDPDEWWKKVQAMLIKQSPTFAAKSF